MSKVVNRRQWTNQHLDPSFKYPNKSFRMTDELPGNVSQQDASVDVNFASEMEDVKFPVQKCGKDYLEKIALDPHIKGAHNIKTITYKPGPVTSKPNFKTKTCLSLKCDLCTFICKINPSMNRHLEMHHKTITAQEQS